MSNHLVYIGFYEIKESENAQLIRLSNDLLPVFLRNRCLEYYSLKDQSLSCAAWMLLAAMLRKYGCSEPDVLTKIRFETSGKPVLVGDWKFSISHSGRLAVCALHQDCLVGVDVEVHRNIEAEELASLYADQNLEQFELYRKAATFFDVWTRKEAFLKACGTGLSDIDYSVCRGSDAITIHYRGMDWYCFSLDRFRDKYSLSICTSESKCPVEISEFNDLG